MNFMIQTRRRRFALYAITIVAGMSISCLVLGLIGYNGNQNLMVAPRHTDQMSALDKSRLAEALHLKAELGDTVWPGYAALAAPVIIWHDDYEFLFGMSAPPAEWTVVPGDAFGGEPYYRRPADDPQNFAVPVGEQWAASIFTKQMLDWHLISAVRDILPPVIDEVFPYCLFIQPSELQIVGVQHEYFHVVQFELAPLKFADARDIYAFEEAYWEIDLEMQAAWRAEIELLINAAETAAPSDAAEIGARFLARREQRRQDFGLSADLIAFETRLEWLEGTAKYVELRSWQEAGSNHGYISYLGMAADPDFKYYETFKSHWNQEMRQTREQAKRQGDVRFYYTGMLQAYLLDRLMPDWKDRIAEDGVYLEDLLREAVSE